MCSRPRPWKKRPPKATFHPLKEKHFAVSQDVLYRQCIKCLQNKVLETSFHRDPHGADGYRSDCIECRKKERELAELEKRASLTTALIDKQGLDALEKLINRPGGSDVPGAAEILEIIIEGFGGPVGYIRAQLADYHAARPGSRERLKFHEQVNRMMLYVDRETGPKRDLTKVDTTDLENMLKTALDRLGDREMTRRIIDGKLVEQRSAVESQARGTANPGGPTDGGG